MWRMKKNMMIIKCGMMEGGKGVKYIKRKNGKEYLGEKNGNGKRKERNYNWISLKKKKMK